MKTAASIVGIVLATALGACAHHNVQSAGAQGPAQAQGNVASTCELTQIPGVHASVADIHKGVAITFTGPEKQLDQLRDAVHKMADANDKRGNAFAVCPCSSGAYGQGAAEAMPGTATQPGLTTPAAKSSVDDIPTGAVLELTAKDDKDVQALREIVRQDVRTLRQNCLSQQGQQQQQQQQQPYGSQYNQYPSDDQ
jgi:hypothetical protein